MPQVQIDDRAWALAQGAYTTLDKLIKDPTTKHDIEKLLKKQNPNLVTTEDVARPYIERVAKLEEQIEKDRRERAERDALQSLNSQFDGLRRRGYTDEGIKSLQQMMVERNLADIEAAAALYEARQPRQPLVAGINSTGWGIGAKGPNPDGIEDAELLWADEDAWLDKHISKAWAEAGL